jgi:hypothetical protein
VYPPSDYAHAVGSFDRPVPLVEVDPDAEPTVCLRFNRDYIPYVLGALEQLLLQSTWDTNDLNRLSVMQSRVFNLMYIFQIAASCADNTTITESDYQNMPEFRTVCEANKEYLEWKVCTCPETWQRLAPISIVPAGGQPGSGQGTPEPGGSQQYCYTLMANQALMLPPVVNTGDTITLDSAKGSWNDGGRLSWYCPDGSIFFADACVGGGAPLSGDPVPTAKHMSIIVYIASVPYALVMGVPFVVPSGVSNDQIQLQANDSAIADNSGSVDICVTVQNNGTATWAHSADFALTSDGFTASSGSGFPPGSWAAGQGWNGGISGAPDTRCLIDRSFGARFITSITVTWESQNGAGSYSPGIHLYHSGPGVLFHALDGSAGMHTDTFPVNLVADEIDPDIFSTGNSTCRLLSWSITGQGTNPF